MDHSISAPITAPLSTHGVIIETRGPVAYVRFDRPPVNAFNAEMLVRFRDVLGEFAADNRPVLLAGTRRIFSAGFDIKQSAAEVARADELSRDVLARVRHHPAPVVAAVEGAAVGLDTDTGPLERFLPTAWIRRLCLTGVGYTPEDMHLAAAGVSVCDAGSAVAVAKTVMRQFGDIDSAFLARAKHRLAFPSDPTPGSSEP